MLKSVVSATLLAAILFSFPLLADRPKYEYSTELTFEGSVLYVGEGAFGLYVVMTDRASATGQVNEITVHLAPSNFLAYHGLEFATGDAIKIVGSRVNWNGTEIILAREVTRRGKAVALRDSNNAPLW